MRNEEHSSETGRVILFHSIGKAKGRETERKRERERKRALRIILSRNRNKVRIQFIVGTPHFAQSAGPGE